jgi:ABC-type branched-subunit amino acid transport system ATPase component/branched-subunit amino acid ABC-type transport system permease component
MERDVSELLPFIVTGLVSGAVYGLAGVGLVLTYKTSGIFNFAHGALATVAAYVCFSLLVDKGWSWPLAAAVAVLVVGPALGLALELMARSVQGTSLALRVASTVGLLLVIEGGLELLYDPSQVRNVPVFLAHGQVEMFGTTVQWADFLPFAFALLATAALSIALRLSRRGVAMRAVVDNPDLLDVAGTSPAATRRLAWVIGVTLAAASGVLFAPLLALNPVDLTLLVIAAFGAAAIGAFASLPMTLAGGLFIGVLASLCTKWFTGGLLAGLAPSLPFVVLFGVLLLFPRRYLAGRVHHVARSRPGWRAPASLQLSGAAVLLVFLAFVPSFVGIRITDWTVALATTIVFLSLGLLVRTSGQVSLSHVAFTAIGACAFSRLTAHSGLPWLPALALSGLVAVPIGAMLAIPAIRLGGLYLALATFGFGILLQQMFYTQGFMFGPNNEGLPEPRPSLSWLTVDTDTGFYYVVLLLTVLTAIFVVGVNRGRMGRLLRGMADSPTALETSGASVNVTRVLVFCLSAFLAACGGALVGVAQNTVSADTYQPLLSLTYFALIIIVVGGEPWSALLAAGSFVLIPSYVTGGHVAVVLQMLFGAAAILFAALPARAHAMPSGLRRVIDSTFGRWRLPSVRRTPTRADAGAPPFGRVAPGALDVEDLQVRFGGLLAVDGVSLRARTGAVTGLIGPNGAGKTTIFNACSGLVRPASGAVRIDGTDVTRQHAAARARRGLGRTFQKMELFDSLTVRENIEAGVEGALAGANPLTHLSARRRDVRVVRQAADQALALCDLTDLADAPANALSTGQRRLVELARCLAGPFRILLLDEPSSGLDHDETRRFGSILRRVVEERGVGVLLVEHDMSLVLDVCDRLYVLDFGRLIYEGTPDEVMASPLVQAAYLGDVEVETAATPGDELLDQGVA